MEMSYPPLWPLAGVMGEGMVEAVLRAGGRIAATYLPRKGRSELAALLVLLVGYDSHVERSAKHSGEMLC